MGRGPRPGTRLFTAAMVAAVLAVGACEANNDDTVLPADSRTGGCEQAFEEAARLSSTPRLQLTLVECNGIGEWVPEAASHPELVPTQDQTRFAASMCATAVAVNVRQSKTCVQALARHPEIRAEPLPTAVR